MQFLDLPYWERWLTSRRGVPAIEGLPTAGTDRRTNSRRCRRVCSERDTEVESRWRRWRRQSHQKLSEAFRNALLRPATKCHSDWIENIECTSSWAASCRTRISPMMERMIAKQQFVRLSSKSRTFFHCLSSWHEELDLCVSSELLSAPAERYRRAVCIHRTSSPILKREVNVIDRPKQMWIAIAQPPQHQHLMWRNKILVLFSWFWFARSCLANSRIVVMQQRIRLEEEWWCETDWDGWCNLIF